MIGALGAGTLAFCVVAGVAAADSDRDAESSRKQRALQIDDLPVVGAAARHPGFSPGDMPEGPAHDPINAENVGDDQAKRVNVLVHLNPTLTRACQERIDVKAFAAQCGSLVKYEYGDVLPNVISLRDIPESDVAALRQMPGVNEVEEDVYYPNLIKLNDAVPLINGLQTQIAAAGLSATGAGVRVCIADTGIDMDHTMYASRIDAAASWDFANNDSNPDDDNGHGSHVAGIAVGGTGLNVDFACGSGTEPFQGVAPNATLIGAKILNSFGGGLSSDIIAGIDHCADQSPTGGRADVINLSIGTGQFTGPCTHAWAVASNNAVANGVVVVAASGNESFGNAVASPACGSDVIAVGATYDATFPTCETPSSVFNWGTCIDSGPFADDIVCFSNQSPMIDVAAPGCDIFSANNTVGGGGIISKCGTSMASPAVAGLAALILSADPSLTPAQVRQIIRDGAVDLGPVGFDVAYGFGRIDVVGSLQLVAPAPGCSINADCDDGLACNGAETCAAGVCQSGTAINCNDGVACTMDACVDPLGTCSNTPDSGQCNDGNACTTDVCDAVSGCTNTATSPCCGNGTCESGENCNTCPGDCFAGTAVNPSCGNGICEAFDRENCKRCPQDCAGTEQGPFCCGDGGDGDNPVSCADSRCTAGGFQCIDVPGTASCCGDGICEGSETNANCAADCGPPAFCGDGFCDPGEDQCNCAADCGAAPALETSCTDGVDNDCDGLADCNDADCASDPTCVVPFCGDAFCDPNEDQCNCAADCGTPPLSETNCTDGADNDCDGFTDCNDADCASDPTCVVPFCGDSICDPNEDQCNCAADCGAPPASETNCTDGSDNDCDGSTDCNDADCDADPACSCLPKKAFCTANEQCCSGICRLNKNECR